MYDDDVCAKHSGYSLLFWLFVVLTIYTAASNYASANP